MFGWCQPYCVIASYYNVHFRTVCPRPLSFGARLSKSVTHIHCLFRKYYIIFGILFWTCKTGLLGAKRSIYIPLEKNLFYTLYWQWIEKKWRSDLFKVMALFYANVIPNEWYHDITWLIWCVIDVEWCAEKDYKVLSRISISPLHSRTINPHIVFIIPSVHYPNLRTG